MTPEGPSHIVVVAADTQLVAQVRSVLPGALMTLTEPLTAFEVVALARRADADLVIVDLDALGPALMETWMVVARPGADLPPVLGITSRQDSVGTLAGAALGLDMVLGGPVEPDLLMVRVAVLTGRAGTGGAAVGVDRPEDLVLDVLHRQVRLGGVELHLTGVEQSLLSLFLAHPGQVLGRERILDEVWGVDYAPASNIVERHVRSLRRKLGEDWHRPRFIETVHGRGYRLRPHGAEQPPGDTGIRHPPG